MNESVFKRLCNHYNEKAFEIAISFCKYCSIHTSLCPIECTKLMLNVEFRGKCSRRIDPRNVLLLVVYAMAVFSLLKILLVEPHLKALLIERKDIPHRIGLSPLIFAFLSLLQSPRKCSKIKHVRNGEMTQIL